MASLALIKKRWYSKVLLGDDCWLWTGAKTGGGYGYLWTGKKIERAHRISYRMFVGNIGDRFVLHKCDTPACVRPSHLMLGTQSDNAIDMVNKGRKRGGYPMCHKEGHVRRGGHCLQCSNKSKNQYYHRKKEAGANGALA